MSKTMTEVSRSICVGALAVLTSFGSTVAQRPSHAEALDLTFGVYTSDKATTMYRMFTPVLEHIQELAEVRLRRSVDVQLRIFKTYSQALDALVKGEVDFVRFGPASYVLAKQRNPKIALLAVEQKAGKRVFKGMIVVRHDSPIRSVEDLRNRTFAFGDRNSTIGRYLAQDLLLQSKIGAADLRRFAYLGGHDSVFRAVEFGDYDAGSLKEGTFKKLNTTGQLRVLETFDNVTKPWIARAGLDPEVEAALRGALLDAERRDALKPLKVDGFVAATDEDFASIRASMQRAAFFEGPAVRPIKPAKPGR